MGLYLNRNMSRIGKKNIFFSSLLNIQTYKNFIIIGDIRNQAHNFSKLKVTIPLQISKRENIISFKNLTETVSNKRLWGTFRSNLNQMIHGLYKKHEVKLKFIGVGYKANLKKNILILRLGFSHKLFCEIPNTLTITKIKKRPLILLLKSNFLDIIKNTAFRLRSFKKPEPYKGKGILLTNEILTLKEKKKT